MAPMYTRLGCTCFHVITLPELVVAVVRGEGGLVSLVCAPFVRGSGFTITHAVFFFTYFYLTQGEVVLRVCGCVCVGHTTGPIYILFSSE